MSLDDARASITEVVYSLQTGGSERIGADIARHLSGRGVDVNVCATHGGSGPISDRLDSEHIPWYGATNRDENRFQRSWRIHRHLRATGCEVVHVHHFNMLSVCYRPARLAGVRRIVATEHSDYAMRMDPDTLRRARRFAKLADHVTVVHGGLKDFVCEELGLPRSSVSVIPNGVDTAFFSPGPRGRLELPESEGLRSPVRICIVGRLHADKDHMNLLEAVVRLRNQGIDGFSVYVIGDGSERDAIQKVITDNELVGTVFLMGNRTDIRDLLREMDVFALSSRTEGLPVAMLEAMSTGIPCVATDVGGVAYALSEGGGLVVPPKDPRALADALAKITKNRELRTETGEAARQTAVARFDCEVMFRDYERILFAGQGRSRSESGSGRLT